MGHISDRADRFAKKFAPPKEEQRTPAEIEAQFARDFGTVAGIREMYNKLKERRDNAGK